MKYKIVRKAATTATFVLASVLFTGTIIANANATVINQALGINSFKKVETNASTKLEDKIYYQSDFDNVGDLNKFGEAAVQQQIEEGTVLLKNDKNALPLKKTEKISLFGDGAYNPVFSGTGSGSVNADTVTYARSLKAAGFTINEDLENKYMSEEWAQYKRGTDGRFGQTKVRINGAPWDVVGPACENSLKEYGDVAFFVVSRIGGEGYDLLSGIDGQDKGDGLGNDYLGLSATEESVLKGLKEKKDAGIIKKIIVVINYSSMVEADFIKDPAYGVDAALWAGAPGQGNLAFGKLISGEYNPSGRLPDTMWMDNAKNPINVNFGHWIYPNAEQIGVSTMVGNLLYPEVTLSSYMVYQEGVYMGYKYTETRYEDQVLGTPNVGSYVYNDVVAYPFAHGLSYSSFDVSNVKVEKTDLRDYTVTLTVTNNSTSDYAGKYSVPIYVSKPYGDYAKKNEIQVPSVELINFTKTKMLKPGESETLTVTLDERYFASYDANNAKGYVLMDGDYYIAVGGSAHEAVNNVLAAKKENGVSIDESKIVGEKGDASVVAKFGLSYNATKYAISDAVSTTDGQRHQITNLFDESDINKYSGRGNNHVDYYNRDHWDKVSLDIVNGHPVLEMTRQMAMEVYSQVPESSGVYNAAQKPSGEFLQPIPKDDGAYPTFGADNGLQLIDLMYDDEGNEIPYNHPIWDEYMDQMTWDELKLICGDANHGTQPCTRLGKPQAREENGPNGMPRIKYTQMPNGLFTLYEIEKGNVTADGKLDKEKMDPEGNKKLTSFASNGLIAASFNKELAYNVGKTIGEQGLWSGCSGLYGLGLNIHRSPYLGRTSEYYSEDGMLTGIIGAIETKALEERGVHVYNKHCALNELESNRHGVQVWLPEQALREIYLRAFELPIIDGGAFATMNSFSRFGTYSGAACKPLADFLRIECGMRGAILTDFYGDMNGNQNVDPYYEQVYGVYYGTCDLVDGSQPGAEGHFDKFGPNTGYSKMAWAMREAVKRCCYQTLWSCAMNGISSSTKLVPITPWWQILLTTLDVVFALAFVASLGWTVVALVKEEKERK